MATIRQRSRYFSIQFRWQRKLKIKPLRTEDRADAERTKTKVESKMGKPGFPIFDSIRG